jgi:hypothetical protein
MHGQRAEPAWLKYRDAYEEALECFEQSQWARAEEILQSLPAGPAGAEDRARTLLLEQVQKCLAEPPKKFDGVFRLSGK